MEQLCDGMQLKYFRQVREMLEAHPDEKTLPDKKLLHAHRFFYHPSMGAVKLCAHNGFIEKSEFGHLTFEGITKPIGMLFFNPDHNVSTGSGKTGGAGRGNTVDRQLENFINKNILPENNAFHSFTVKTLKELQLARLRPFWAQVPVGDPRLALATTLDLVCIDMSPEIHPDESNLVNVQLKTGFKDNYTKSKHFMRSPFTPDSKLNSVPDNYQNRHYVQIAVEHMITNLNYGNVLRKSMILVIPEGKARHLPLPKHFHALAKDIYVNLLQRKTKPNWEIQAMAAKEIEETKERNKRTEERIRKTDGRIIEKKKPLDKVPTAVLHKIIQTIK